MLNLAVVTDMWRHRWGILSDNNEVGTINMLLYICVS